MRGIARESSSQGKSSYHESLVVYLDLLGFSEMVRESESDPDRVEATLRALDKLRPVQGQQFWDLRFERLSDSVVLVSPPIADELSVSEWTLHAIYWASDAQVRLLDYGLMVRGGIAKGKVAYFRVQDGAQSVYGPALIDACRLAEDKAHFSRVIVQESLVSQKWREDWNRDRSSPVMCLNDGNWFIDYLIPRFPLVIGDGKPDWEELLSRLDRHRKSLLQYAERARTPASLARCAWTMWYHNNTVRRVLWKRGDGSPAGVEPEQRRRLKELLIPEFDFMAYSTPPVGDRSAESGEVS